MKSKTLQGLLCAIASAVIYGCMPLMSKYIYAEGVTPLALVFLRNALSLIPLGILAYRENKTLQIPLGQLPAICLASLLGCCITPVLLFLAYDMKIASGTVTVFHFVYPAVVVIAEILFLRKKAKAGNLISVALCVAGICMFYTPGSDFHLTGSLLALLSGFTFAAYVVCLSVFRERIVSGFLFCFYITLVSSIASFLICLFTGNLTFPSTWSGWGLCFLFSLLITTCAVSLFQRSAYLIGGERTAILSTLEPITGVVVGAAVLGEPMGFRVLIGSVLVIAASLLIALVDLGKKKEA